MADVKPKDEEDRFEEIARAVHSYLREGESILVSVENGEVYVSPSEGTPLRESHPRLYGRLSSINEQLAAGCAPFLLAWLVGFAFLFCLHAGVVEFWWGDAAAQALQGWGFYVLLFAALTLFVYLGVLAREARVFRRARDELYGLMRREGVDRDTLVSMLAVEPDMRSVMVRLRLDTGPFEENAEGGA